MVCVEVRYHSLPLVTFIIYLPIHIFSSKFSFYYISLQPSIHFHFLCCYCFPPIHSPQYENILIMWTLYFSSFTLHTHSPYFSLHHLITWHLSVTIYVNNNHDLFCEFLLLFFHFKVWVISVVFFMIFVK